MSNKATYVKPEGAITIGDSFRDSWGFESDALKQIRTKMGESYPRSSRRDVVPDGNFKSGLERFKWTLIDTTEYTSPVEVESRNAMKRVGRDGEEYYLISRFPYNV